MLLTKIFTDLSAHPTRTWLAIVSMAMGLFTVLSLVGMMDLQLQHMDATHQQSRPAVIQFILRGEMAAAGINTLAAMPDIAGIDSFSQTTVRYRLNAQSAWQTAIVILRPDYLQQKYDRLTLGAGDWPTAETIALEQLSAKHLQHGIGDSIELDTQQGARRLTVSGIIRHPFVKPPGFGGPIHFFISAEQAPLFGLKPDSFRQLLIQTTTPDNNVHNRDIATNLRLKLAELGIPVATTLMQDPKQHWGRPFFQGLHWVLHSMAWSALALSAILIYNTVNTTLNEHAYQIGIMKALGAKRRVLMAIYIGETLVIAVIALCLAIPTGLATAYYSSAWLLALFNSAVTQFDYSERALLLTLAGGLIVPIASALLPIYRSVAMPVRLALASYGLGADYAMPSAPSKLERFISQQLPTPYALVLIPLLHKKAKCLSAQAVLILTGVMFIVIMSLADSLKLTLANELARSHYTVRLSFHRDQSQSVIQTLANAEPETQGVEFWQRQTVELSFQQQPVIQTGSLGAQLIGLPVMTPAYQPLITEGRWFNADDDFKPHLVLSADTAALNHINIGDAIQLTPAGHATGTWQVIGLYRSFTGTSFSIEPIYAPITALAPNNSPALAAYALITANTQTLADEQDYAERLKQACYQQGIPVDIYASNSLLAQRQHSENQFRPSLAMLLGLASMIASVGAIGLTGYMSSQVLQKTREIGVLRAIGADASQISRLFILEGLAHGILAWLISSAIAYAIAEPCADKLGTIMLNMKLDFAFSWYSVALWLALSLLLALFATLIPAKQAAKLTIKECLAYG